MSSASRLASARVARASRCACSRISEASRAAAARTSAASSSASRSMAVARPPRPAYDGFLFSSSSMRTDSRAASSSPIRAWAWLRLPPRRWRSSVSWRRCWSTAALSYPPRRTVGREAPGAGVLGAAGGITRAGAGAGGAGWLVWRAYTCAASATVPAGAGGGVCGVGRSTTGSPDNGCWTGAAADASPRPARRWAASPVAAAGAAGRRGSSAAPGCARRPRCPRCRSPRADRPRGRRRRWTGHGHSCRPVSTIGVGHAHPASHGVGELPGQTPRKRLIACSWVALSSALRTPSPSSGARQSTPTLPWWALRCTSSAAWPVSSIR